MIDLYIFDEGGVLIRGFNVLPSLAAAMDRPLDEVRRLILPDMGDYSRGRVDGDEFWRRFTARTGIAPAENYWRTLFRPTRDEPTFALVRELAAGARVVCGTNTIDCHHVINEELGMYEPFQRVYASHLMGLAKPDPEFWLRILEAEGVAPERAFFTDDSQDNVDVALKLGLKARLYTDAARLRKDLAELGAPVVA